MYSYATIKMANIDDDESISLSEETTSKIVDDISTWKWEKDESFLSYQKALTRKDLEPSIKKVVSYLKEDFNCRINYLIAWELTRKSEVFAISYKERFGRSFYIVSLLEDSNVSFIKEGKHDLIFLSKGTIVDVSRYLATGYTLSFVRDKNIINEKEVKEKAPEYRTTILLFCRQKKAYK